LLGNSARQFCPQAYEIARFRLLIDASKRCAHHKKIFCLRRARQQGAKGTGHEAPQEHWTGHGGRVIAQLPNLEKTIFSPRKVAAVPVESNRWQTTVSGIGIAGFEHSQIHVMNDRRSH
jgi:hypothetical protein